MLITNNSKAAQGLLVGGKVAWLKPGEARELDYKRALPDGVTASESKPAPQPAAEPGDDKGDRFDNMEADELRDFIEDATGDRPHPRTGRDKLLVAARAV